MALKWELFDVYDGVNIGKVLIGSAVGFYAGYSIYKWISTRKHNRNLKRKVKARLQIRSEQIQLIRELTSDVTPELESEISSLGIEELLDSLKRGTYSCSAVLKVYQKRALYSQELTNCITEFILEANTTAAEYDERFKQNPDADLPPLFGLPISVKANISFKGRDQFKGYAQDLEMPTETDSVIVEHLQELGAIIFVLTNVPQTLLTYSCENPVYGSTCHPLDKNRTSGGSSGGEGALIASGGSIVGIGSDIGGSIRIPASFCGVVGFKPCSKRISAAGTTGSVPGRSHVFGCTGPIGNDVRACVEIMRNFWDKKWIHQYDAYIAPVDFNEEMYKSTKKLRIGYFDTNGFLEPLPVMKRAVNEARERLERNGHELVLFEPPNVLRAYYLFTMAVTLDNGRFIINRWDSDLPVPGYRQMLMPLRWPFWLRKLLSFLLRPFNQRAGDAIGAFHKSTHELLLVYQEIEAYWMVWKKLMKEKNLDCFICPVFPCPAMRHKEPYRITFNCSYTGLFNLLDFPAGTVPVTTVRREDLDNLNNYKASDYYEKLLVKSAKGTLNFPVGVQVCSLPYRDEMVLRVMREIEDSIKGEKNKLL